MQAAVVSVLEDGDMKFHRSFYYWAAFIAHGFASVKLDDALLDGIHAQLETFNDRSDPAEHNSHNDPLEMAMLTVTRKAYHRLEDQEKTLSREKWGVR